VGVEAEEGGGDDQEVDEVVLVGQKAGTGEDVQKGQDDGDQVHKKQIFRVEFFEEEVMAVAEVFVEKGGKKVQQEEGNEPPAPNYDLDDVSGHKTVEGRERKQNEVGAVEGAAVEPGGQRIAVGNDQNGGEEEDAIFETGINIPLSWLEAETDEVGGEGEEREAADAQVDPSSNTRRGREGEGAERDYLKEAADNVGGGSVGPLGLVLIRKHLG
jgi:hypothetical protein